MITLNGGDIILSPVEKRQLESRIDELRKTVNRQACAISDLQCRLAEFDLKLGDQGPYREMQNVENALYWMAQYEEFV